MRTLSCALTRGTLTGALPILSLWLSDKMLDPEHGANIGGGLLLLVALVVLPLLWARRDATARGTGATIVLWILAAVAPWLADAARVYVDNGGAGVGDAAGSLVAAGFVVPFFIGGSLLGALMGASGRPSNP